jgi:disulfide bond formation protein DsbB
MSTLLSGILFIVVGFVSFIIPIIGEILGPIFIFLGIIGVIIGIFQVIIGFMTSANSSKEQVIIHKNIVEQSEPTQLSMADELQKVSQLYEKGHITEDEFNASKKSIMTSQE